jgi:hypothetical protein
MLSIERLFLDLGLELDKDKLEQVEKKYIVVPKGVRVNRKDVIIDVFNKIALLHGLLPEEIFGIKIKLLYICIIN